jgi:hypothetical protein
MRVEEGEGPRFGAGLGVAVLLAARLSNLLRKLLVLPSLGEVPERARVRGATVTILLWRGCGRALMELCKGAGGGLDGVRAGAGGGGLLTGRGSGVFDRKRSESVALIGSRPLLVLGTGWGVAALAGAAASSLEGTDEVLLVEAFAVP